MQSQTSSDRDRARRYRARRRGGILVLTVVANEVALTEALVDAKLLKPEYADNRPALEHAVQKLIDVFVREK